MAQEIVGVKIQVEGNASESIGSLKKQLREAQNEVTALSEKFGATSDQAVKAAKRAAQLKDAIGDAKALTDAYNPDAKFKAFSAALQGVVGGISAVQGAMGLLGVENEAVEQTLLKVNSAMALSQGLNSILEARDSFRNLGKRITDTTIFQKANNAATTVAIALQKAFGVATIGTGRAFTILKGAIAATGIGLLVIGLTTLIGKIQEWTSSSDKAAEAQKKLAAETDLINAKLDNQISVLTALGGKEKEIYQLKLQQTRNELAVLDAAEKSKKKLTDEEIKRKGDLSTQLQVLDIQEKNRLAKIDEDAKKKQDDKNKEASEKAKAAAQERINANKDADEKIRSQSQENFLLTIKDEDERAKKKLDFDLQNRLLEINALTADEEKKKQLRLLAIRSTALAIVNLEEEIKKGKKEKEEKERIERQENEKKNEEERATRIRQQYEYDKTLREEFQQAELESIKYVQEQKNALLDAGINFALALAGRNEKLANAIFAVQKAIEIGRIITTTTASIAKIKADTFSIPAFVGPGLPNPLFVKALAAMGAKIAGLKIGAAASIASIAASTISKFKSGSSGGNVGGAQDAGSVGGGSSAPIAPELPQATLTQLDQQTINRLGSATNRAYVVESDVTNSQERIRRINRAARLN